MMPMLRFFRHGDGNFALFNGMGPTRSDLVSTVLAYDDARGMPVANAPHSGYQRVRRARPAARRRGPPAPARGEPRGARRLPFVRILGAKSPHRGELRHARDKPGNLAPRRARDSGPFHRDLQRHLVMPLSHLEFAEGSHRRANSLRPVRGRGVAPGARRRHHAAALARRLRCALRCRASAHAAPLA